MGFKDLFFESEENTAGTQKPQQPVYQPQTPTAKPAPAYNAMPPVAQSVNIQAAATQPISHEAFSSSEVSTSKSDVTMIKQLYDCIIAHNLPGPDYLELKNIADALSKYMSDDGARYSAAFDTLKQQYPSLTKDVILNAIQTYATLIESERARGLQQCKDAFDKLDLSEKIRSDNARAEEIMMEIKRLQIEHDKITANIKNLTDKNEIAINKYQHDCEVFNASVNAVIATLNADRDKISKLTL